MNTFTFLGLLIVAVTSQVQVALYNFKTLDGSEMSWKKQATVNLNKVALG